MKATYYNSKSPRIDWEKMSNQKLEETLKQMKKIADKKGVVVIMDNDSLITTYNLCSYNRKLSRLH
ncbi:hypothetical protein NUS48_05580 [Glaesserella parasuis]|nr:hypothetical protein [Glaesserella parasuis]MDE3970419.1 hypothetical protein [Glaesserella parasuis]MDE3982352.1 hypothetical protein [Glaesserella parasuis]MDE3991297.1 hypothetical protein [Glaesserella parasuis]